jgi:hypothetical protein
VYHTSANAHEGIPYQVSFELLSIVVKNWDLAESLFG